MTAQVLDGPIIVPNAISTLAGQTGTKNLSITEYVMPLSSKQKPNANKFFGGPKAPRIPKEQRGNSSGASNMLHDISRKSSAFGSQKLGTGLLPHQQSRQQIHRQFKTKIETPGVVLKSRPETTKAATTAQTNDKNVKYKDAKVVRNHTKNKKSASGLRINVESYRPVTQTQQLVIEDEKNQVFSLKNNYTRLKTASTTVSRQAQHQRQVANSSHFLSNLQNQDYTTYNLEQARTSMAEREKAIKCQKLQERSIHNDLVQYFSQKSPAERQLSLSSLHQRLNPCESKKGSTQAFGNYLHNQITASNDLNQLNMLLETSTELRQNSRKDGAATKISQNQTILNMPQAVALGTFNDSSALLRRPKSASLYQRSQIINQSNQGQQPQMLFPANQSNQSRQQLKSLDQNELMNLQNLSGNSALILQQSLAQKQQDQLSGQLTQQQMIQLPQQMQNEQPMEANQSNSWAFNNSNTYNSSGPQLGDPQALPIIIQLNTQDSIVKIENDGQELGNLNEDALIQLYQKQSMQDSQRMPIQSPSGALPIYLGSQAEIKSLYSPDPGNRQLIEMQQDGSLLQLLSPMMAEADANRSIKSEHQQQLESRASKAIITNQGNFLAASSQANPPAYSLSQNTSIRQRNQLELQNQSLNHKYMEEMRLQKYQFRLRECEQNLNMLHDRLLNASNKQSREELIKNQFEDTQKKISIVLGSENFRPEQQAQKVSLNDIETMQLYRLQQMQLTDKLNGRNSQEESLLNQTQQHSAQNGQEATLSQRDDCNCITINNYLQLQSMLQNTQHSPQQPVTATNSHAQFAANFQVEPTQGQVENPVGSDSEQQRQSQQVKELEAVRESAGRRAVSDPNDEFVEIQKSFEDYENYGRNIIQQSLQRSSGAHDQSINNNQQSVLIKTQLSNQCGPKEIDLENAPQHLLPGPSTTEIALTRLDESHAQMELGAINESPVPRKAENQSISQINSSILNEVLRDEPISKLDCVLRTEDYAEKKGQAEDLAKGFSEDNDYRYIPEDSSPLQILRQRSSQLRSQSLNSSVGLESNHSRKHGQNNDLNKLDVQQRVQRIQDIHIKSLGDQDMKEVYSHSDGTKLGVPSSQNLKPLSATSDSQNLFVQNHSFKDQSEAKRQKLRNRQQQLLLSLRHISSKQYLTNEKTKMYINKRPTSSKDALLKRPPLSKGILRRRAKEVSQALEEAWTRQHNFQYDELQILLGDYQQRSQQLHEFDKKRSRDDSNCQPSRELLNQSMKSTLNVGSDTVLRSSLHLRDGSNASPGKKSNSDDSREGSSLDNMIAVDMKKEASPSDLKEALGINKETVFPIKQLFSADLQSVNTDQKVQISRLIKQMGGARLKKQYDGNKDLSPVVQSPSGSTPQTASPKILVQNQESEPIENGDAPASPPGQKAPPNAYEMAFGGPGPRMVQDQLLLLEMKRQIRQDDDEIRDLLDDYSRPATYKIDPSALNQKLTDLHKSKPYRPLSSNDYASKEIVFSKTNSIQQKSDLLKQVQSKKSFGEGAAAHPPSTDYNLIQYSNLQNIRSDTTLNAILSNAASQAYDNADLEESPSMLSRKSSRVSPALKNASQNSQDQLNSTAMIARLTQMGKQPQQLVTKKSRSVAKAPPKTQKMDLLLQQQIMNGKLRPELLLRQQYDLAISNINQQISFDPPNKNPMKSIRQTKLDQKDEKFYKVISQQKEQPKRQSPQKMINEEKTIPQNDDLAPVSLGNDQIRAPIGYYYDTGIGYVTQTSPEHKKQLAFEQFKNDIQQQQSAPYAVIQRQDSKTLVKQSSNLAYIRSDKNLNFHMGLARNRSGLSKNNDLFEADDMVNQQYLNDEDEIFSNKRQDQSKLERDFQETNTSRIEAVIQRKAEKRADQIKEANNHHFYKRRISFMRESSQNQNKSHQQTQPLKPEQAAQFAAPMAVRQSARPQTGQPGQRAAPTLRVRQERQAKAKRQSTEVESYDQLMIVGQSNTPQDRTQMHAALLGAREKQKEERAKERSRISIKNQALQECQKEEQEQFMESVGYLERNLLQSKSVHRMNISQELQRMSQLEQLIQQTVAEEQRTQPVQQYNVKQDQATGLAQAQGPRASMPIGIDNSLSAGLPSAHTPVTSPPQSTTNQHKC